MANWQTDAREAAMRYGLNPNVFIAQMGQEAHGQDLTSPAGAQGPAQFMPGTARGVGLTPVTVHQRVPAYNAAAKLMAGYVKQYGSVKNALVAYNAGPGRVGGPLPAETQNYIKTVLGAGGSIAPAPAQSAQATPDPVSAMTVSAPTAGPTTDPSALIHLAAQQRQAPTSGALPTPAALPDAYKALASTRGPAARQDISALISASRTPGASETAPVASREPASAPLTTQKGSKASSGKISPHAVPGSPVVSTKQSEGGAHQTAGLAGFPAHDYFAPAGSHAVAPISGTVVKLSGHNPKDGAVQGAGGPLGWSVYIKGTDGKTYFMTHLGARNVKVGQELKQGQVIGTVANYDKYGRPSHIHMGVSGS